MKKRNIIVLGLFLLFYGAIAQPPRTYFPANELTTVGAYYYPEHWDESQWDRDLRKMSEMGFEFVHYAGFAWAFLEPEEGKYDFSWLDRAVALAAKHNLKVLLATSTAAPPVWLVRKYPEVLKTNEDGTRWDHGTRQHASFSNNFYREYSQKMIAELAKHYGQDQRIIGWQTDNEPQPNVDYGEDAQQRFGAWLKDKYGAIDTLNQAWGTNFWGTIYSDFSQINLPKKAHYGLNLYQQMDHSRFCDFETASYLDKQATTIRQYANENQWITTNYIPSFEDGQIGRCKNLDFISYTRYMVYGGQNGIGVKGYRLGEYTQIAMANDYFRSLSPTYGVMELQPGQVNWGSVNSQPLPGAVRLWLWHIFAGGSKFTCTYRFRAPIYGFEQYHYGVLGTDGVTPTRGGLEFEEFIDEVKVLRENYDSGNVPENYLTRRTAILYDPDNAKSINLSKQTVVWSTAQHVSKYYETLKSFGAPVDFIRDTTDFKGYPVLVVPAYQQMSLDLIQKLTDYVKDGGNLVMTCRSGHQDERGHFWEAKHAEPIYELIGGKIEFFDLLKPSAPDTIDLAGQTFAWTSWGDILTPDEGTTVWGVYKGDFYAGAPAITYRELGRGTVTYVGVDSNEGDMERVVLEKLYKRLGIPIERYPKGIVVEYRDGFGVALNYTDEEFEMELPKNTKILIGEKSIPRAGVLVWKLN